MQNLSFVLPTNPASLATSGSTNQLQLLQQEATAIIVCCYLDYRTKSEALQGGRLEVSDFVNLVASVRSALG
jgi:hypothetical protein